MEIKFYLRIIQRSWWMIVISALVATNLSLAYSYYFVTPMYESVARFIVSPNLQSTDSRDLVNSLEALDKRSIIATYAEVLNSSQIVESAIQLLQANPDEFSEYTTSVTVLPDASIIRFSVQGPDPEVAAMLANGIGQYAINVVKNLYVVYDINFLDKAIASEEPYQPQPLQDAGLALLAGLMLGVGLAIFRDQLTSSLEKLTQRKMIDAESLAYSRSYFERLIREEISNQPEGVLTMGIIQLDGIQEFYDLLPQAYINQIMRKVTETLKYQLRGNDVVGRWSQLQFGVMLPSTEGEFAKQKMDRIRKALGELKPLQASGEFEIHLDPHIGLTERKGQEPLPVLVKQAEQALEFSLQSKQETVHLFKR